MTTTIHDFRAAALTKERNIMLNSMNADETIDVVLAGVVPSKHDHVLLTIQQDGEERDTQWRVESATHSDTKEDVCHAILKFEKNV